MLLTAKMPRNTSGWVNRGGARSKSTRFHSSMRTTLFDYHLPRELIAQTPISRGESRLMVLDRTSGAIRHRQFSDLLEYLVGGDVLVLNDTRVSARRLRGIREGGEPAEILLLRPVGARRWEALVNPGRGLKPGRTVQLIGPEAEGLQVAATVVDITSEGGRLLEFADSWQRDLVGGWGKTPLPPYIHSQLSATEEDRYQTVYATADGSAAAPTAGLHFTRELLDRATQSGVQQVYVTLHIGVDTFRPVRAAEIEAHEMHGEIAELSSAAATAINATRGRIVAVGTTSVRVLESAATTVSTDYAEGTAAVKCAVGKGESSPPPARRVAPFAGETHLFISPGYQFQAVDALITNFHLPRSTLLMLVSAFAGCEAILEAYHEAIRQRYRFFSFGDAMLIL